jgi:plastocyanin
MHMSRTQMKVANTIVALAAGCVASCAWAGDVHGKVTAQGLRTAENIAVYIDSVPGKTFTAPGEHAIMNQSHLAYVPHVLVVQQGTTVDFKNEDSVGHNVYWPSVSHNKKSAHNMGTWPQGQSKTFTFTELGDVPLLCNVHPEMSGYIFVVPTPYFAVTDKEGNFVIKNVPAGQYTLKTGSEGGKPASQPVTVGSGAVSVSVTVTK